jgi:monovalent cation/hydrogen antiporter
MGGHARLLTIATALALPQGFPERGKLLFAAFTVTLGTLLIQGLTLRPLVLALRVPDDESIDRELREARVATVEAALTALAEEPGQEAEALRAELHQEHQTARIAEGGDGLPIVRGTALRAKALAARRDRLLALRSEGRIGDEAFHRLEEELDFSELALAKRS